MGAVTPTRVANWLGLAYAAAIAVATFSAADAPDVVLMGFIAIPWLVGPALAAAVCAKASRTLLGAWLFVALEAVIVASTVAGWSYLIYVDPHSTNAIAMLFTLPLAQYGAAALFFALVSAFGWRARRAFLEA
jgi:hypothetical protein